MRVNVSTNHAKMVAKRLKRSLVAREIETKLSVCQNVVARLYGYAHYYEFHKRPASLTSTRFYEFDAETVAACHQYQKTILTQAGFAVLADVLLEEIDPMGLKNALVQKATME